MVDAPSKADAAAGRVIAGDAAAALAPLDARLRQIAPYIEGVDVATDSLAAQLARAVSRSLRDPDIWLVIVGFTTVFPTLDEHAAVRRALGLVRSTPSGRHSEGAGGSGDSVELAALLDALKPIIRRVPSLGAPITIVRGGTVVDATFTGRSDHNTGVQRVLRETASRWSRTRDITLVGWNPAGTSFHGLVGREVARVTDWAAHSSRSPEERREPDAVDGARASIVVPVESVVVCVEVAQPQSAPALAALARVSGNSVALVGHDLIPVVSAQGQSSEEIERFARFLTVVKHASRVAGVSASAAAEFAGFASALGAQGIDGPVVVAVPLAMSAPASPLDRPQAEGNIPLVLVVGSQDARKNHDAILFAARRLWAEGIPFRLRFIGGGSSAALSSFGSRLAEARADGFDAELLAGAGDTVLLASYAEARFSVFPSLHEGFGLPVAESLALGTPVITSNHGSLREIAEGGGCLMVDAYDDEQLRRAMRSLLVDDAVYESLRAEAVARSFRSWDDYAGELWASLVEPVRAELDAGEAPPVNVQSAGALLSQHPGAPDAAKHPSSATPPAGDPLLAGWWAVVEADSALARARERSVLRPARKVVPLARFFVARSREMGIVPATRAAWRIVGRRLVRG